MLHAQDAATQAVQISFIPKYAIGDKLRCRFTRQVNTVVGYALWVNSNGVYELNYEVRGPLGDWGFVDPSDLLPLT